MKKYGLVIFLALAVASVSLFLGCASVPKEELDEKEAVIQNLNSQIESLRQEVAKFRQANEELMAAKSDIEYRLMKAQKAQLQKPIEEKTEPKVK